MGEKLKLPNGEWVTRVDKEYYLLCETIRNYVLRLNYETKTPMWMCIIRAEKKYGVTENVVKTALKHWRKWYYENGLRHRPLELLIQEQEKQNNNGNKS